MIEKFRERSSNLPNDPVDLKDLHLQALEPSDKPYDRLVGSGLVLRVMPSGSISFRFNYRHNSKQRIASIGLWPKKSLKVLRAEYDLMKSKADDGVDVRQDKLKKKAARRSAAVESREERARKRNVMRVEGLADLFLKHIESLRAINKRGRPYSAKTIKEYRSHLLNHIVPKFGAIAVEDLERKVLASWLKKKATKAPSQANHLLSTLSAMFSWATDEEILEANLVAGMKKPGGKQQSKKRALDYDPDIQEIVDKGEIRTFWNGLGGANPLHRMSLRMVLMSALRPGEVLGAKWEHLLEDRWVIPVDATKNKQDAHKIPLTQDLKNLLAELHEITGDTPYLFPQSRYEDGELHLVKNGRTGRFESTETSTVSKILRTDLGVESFTPHDLRRTAATHIKALGYLDAEIGVLLHHSTGDVTAIYARGDDLKRKKKMLNTWHRQLKVILSGED